MCASTSGIPRALRATPAPRWYWGAQLSREDNDRGIYDLVELGLWRAAMRAALEAQTPKDRIEGVRIVLERATDVGDAAIVKRAQQLLRVLTVLYPTVSVVEVSAQLDPLWYTLHMQGVRAVRNPSSRSFARRMNNGDGGKVITEIISQYPLKDFQRIAPAAVRLHKVGSSKRVRLSNTLPGVIGYAIEDKHTNVEAQLMAHLGRGIGLVSRLPGSMARAFYFVQPILDAYVLAGRPNGVRRLMAMFPKDSARYATMLRYEQDRYQTPLARRALQALLPDVLNVLSAQQKASHTNSSAATAPSHSSYTSTPRPHKDATRTVLRMCMILRGACLKQVFHKSAQKERLIVVLASMNLFGEALTLSSMMPPKARATHQASILRLWNQSPKMRWTHPKLWKRIRKVSPISHQALYREFLLAQAIAGRCAAVVRRLSADQRALKKRAFPTNRLAKTCLLKGYTREALDLIVLNSTPHSSDTLNLLAMMAYTIDVQALMRQPNISARVNAILKAPVPALKQVVLPATP